MADIEKHLLQVLDRDGVIEDSESFASTSGYDHKAVVSSIKSLQSYEMIAAEVLNLVTRCLAPQGNFAAIPSACHGECTQINTIACRRRATPGSSLQQKGRMSARRALQNSECMGRSRGMKKGSL